MDLTVIVTCFNKKDFIARFCREAEEIMRLGCELVVVDDASKDGSSYLLSDFSKKHPEMNLYLSTSNQGSAASRNFGLKKATRSYIFFLDIDDFCNFSELCILFGEMIASNSDLAVANLSIEPEGALLPMPFETELSQTISIKSISSKISSSMGYSRYIYKRRYIAESLIRFFPSRIESSGNYFILDDVFWLILISASSGTMLVSRPDRIIYHYNRPVSTSNSWKIYLSQIIQLPVLVLSFLQEFNKNTKLNIRILQENTFEWFFETMKVLPFKHILDSRILSPSFLRRLKHELPWISCFRLIEGVFTIFLTSLKNSINLRSRIKTLLVGR